MIAKALRNKILWSTFVQYAGKIVQMGLGIIGVKLVTNAIGLEEYGIYGKISEYALFFSVAANLGIFGNVVRKMSEKPEDGQLFVNALFLRMSTALLFFMAGGIYAWLFQDGVFAWGVLFFMSSLFFDYITSVCDAMLQANYKMGRAVFALVLGRAANLSIVVLLASAAGATSAPLYFLAPLGASILTAGLSLFFVRQQIDLIWKIEKSILTNLFITALPFGIINILNNLYFRFLPSLFAAKALNDEQFGSYNISLHLATAAALLSTFLMYSSLPAFKRSLKEKHFRRAKEIYKRLQQSLLFFGILAVGIGSWLAPFAIQLISNKTFVIPELWFILPMMLLLGSISYFYDLVLIILFALEKEIWFMKWEFFALFCASLVLFSSLLSFSPEIKIILVLLGAIIGESLMVGLGLFKIQKELKELEA